MPAPMRNVAYSVVHRLAWHVKGRLIGGVKARLSGAESFGCSPMIFDRVKFATEGRLIIGERFLAAGHLTGVLIKVVKGATLSIGNDVALNHGVEIEAWHDVRIGSNVLLGPYVSIIDDDRHLVTRDAPLYHGPVTRNIPPNCFAVGSPARILKKLDLPDGWVRHGRPAVLPGPVDRVAAASGGPGMPMRDAIWR